MGVKCATITPDEARVAEFGLKQMALGPTAPSATSWAGSCSCEPIICSNVPRLVPGWTKPIVIGRHATPTSTSHRLPGARPRHRHHQLHPRRRRRADGADVAKFSGSGIAMGMYNFDDSIRDFARASLRYGLERHYPVYLSTKDTILKAYDGRFKDLFQEVFDTEFKADYGRRRPHLRAPPHRRHGRPGHEVGGRLRVGVQELRRRRAVQTWWRRASARWG